MALLFSRDRALQLDATLKSFLLCCRDPEPLDMRVLYTTTTALHAKQYEQLEKEYQKYPFLKFIREQHFRGDTIALLAPFEYVLFLVDDNIFVRDFNMFSILESLQKNPDAVGFSLRLGKNTTYCYALDKEQCLPEFQSMGQGILKHNWTTAEYDFGYPLEVSSSVYRVQDILPFIAQLPFTNPNTLEALMNVNKSVFQNEKLFLLCFEQSVTFCAPINIVQTDWVNRASGKVEYGSENLAKLFSDGARIDISTYENFIPNACHQEVEFQFIDQSGKRIKPISRRPLVSVIILNYNGLEDIRICLESIKRNTPEDHEIIVVDNGSTDGSLEYLRSLPDIMLVENPTNIGCPPARAQAMCLARGDYVILLDNDSIVTKDWVKQFVNHAKAHSDIGIIGPRSNYVSGIQLVQNVSYKDINELEEFASNFARQYQGQLTPTIRLVGLCMFISRKVIDKIGNIDASFGKFGFEDDDYTWRAYIAGFRAVIANDIFIHHSGGPQGRGDSRYNQLLIDAWEVFKQKWELPKELPYGAPFDLSSIIIHPFDPQKHYVPMTDRSTVEKLLYVARRPEKAKVREEIMEQKTPIIQQKQRVKDLVSFVILISDRQEYIRKCLQSIKKYTPEPHEIIFVPIEVLHASVKWLRKRIRENKNYKLIENNPILPPFNSPLSKGGYRGVVSYAPACNQGLAESSGEYVVILHEDVVVTDGWLSGMLECLNGASDIGIVGPMTVNVEGPQGTTKTEYNSLVYLDQFAKTFRERNRYRYVKVKNLKGFCILFRHELVEKIGSLDERFDAYNFIYDDYCLRAEIEGYRNLIAADIFIHHFASFMNEKASYTSTVTDRNKKTFVEKWKSVNYSSPMWQKLVAMNTLNAADELSQKGQEANAITVLIEGLKHSPDDKRIHYAIVELLIEGKNFKDALDVLENMPEEMRGDPKRTKLIGYCMEGMGRLEEAEKCADEILALNSISTGAWNLKGLIAFKKGLNTDAENFFKKAIQYDGGFGEAYANLGALSWGTGNKEEALKLLERAFILSPTLKDVVRNYFAVVFSLSKLEQAEGLLTETIAFYPFNRALYHVLLDILIKQGKYDDAIVLLDAVMVTFGVDDNALARAKELRNRVGAKEIDKTATDTISLCMIVKNEENKIVRSLTSIKPVVDEMIVVDTGSTDRTKEIAKALGAKVYDFKWTDNFSDARNFSISKASGKWILILDADEVISSLDHESLKKLVKIHPPSIPPLPRGDTEGSKGEKGGLVAYSFITRNYVIAPNTVGWVANDGSYMMEEAGTGWFAGEKVRLFPNDGRIRFDGPVHERIEPSLEKAEIEIKPCLVPIHHYGMLSKEKAE
jgi:GT2 family glycosyltransferase/Flp pilus assembly protein TadD